MQKRALKRNDICGPFRIVRFIARGHTSEVYEAEHEVTGERVALKMLARRCELDIPARRRMEAETALLGAIDHPNVIRALESGEREGLPWRAMELAAGKTLRARFDAAPEPISVAVGLCFARQIVDAIGTVHAIGGAHGALTPENLLLTEIEEVKLVDLGDAPLIARGLKVGARFARSKASGAEADRADGSDEVRSPSMRYAAPELLRGAPADARADVYSAGVILYEMLAGEHPFAPASAGRRAKTRAVELPGRSLDPPPLPAIIRGFPTSTWEIIAKAIAREPSARFASMEELGDAINEAWNVLLDESRAGAELNAALSLLAQALQVGGGDPNEPPPDLETLLQRLTAAAELAEGGSVEEDSSSPQKPS
jgi:eukaryotic-like serine/threonine-protein kinase